jgi:hypothetical protein
MKNDIIKLERLYILKQHDKYDDTYRQHTCNMNKVSSHAYLKMFTFWEMYLVVLSSRFLLLPL